MRALQTVIFYLGASQQPVARGAEKSRSRSRKTPIDEKVRCSVHSLL
jgi:hypothetical protein